MGAIAERLLAGRLTEGPELLRAEVVSGTVTEIAAVYRAIAVACIEKQLKRVLVIAGDDDPAGERALRVAVTVMVLAGVPAGLRLALVATRPRVTQVYRNTPRDLSAVGVTTQLFESEGQAVLWLDGARSGAQRFA